VKLRVCSNSDRSNSLIPRAKPPSLLRSLLCAFPLPPSLPPSLSLSLASARALVDAYTCTLDSLLFPSTRCGSIVQSIMYTPRCTTCAHTWNKRARARRERERERERDGEEEEEEGSGKAENTRARGRRGRLKGCSVRALAC